MSTAAWPGLSRLSTHRLPVQFESPFSSLLSPLDMKMHDGELLWNNLLLFFFKNKQNKDKTQKQLLLIWTWRSIRYALSPLVSNTFVMFLSDNNESELTMRFLRPRLPACYLDWPLYMCWLILVLPEYACRQNLSRASVTTSCILCV